MRILHNRVAAVVAAVNGDASRLPETLRAVAKQTLRPQRVLVFCPADSKVYADLSALCAELATAETEFVLCGEDTENGAENSEAGKKDPKSAGFASAVDALLRKDAQLERERNENAGGETENIGRQGENIGSRAASGGKHGENAKGNEDGSLRSARAGSWYWILHPDSAPMSSALALQMRLGEQSARIGIVGAKQISWDPNPDGSYNLLEAGICATRFARRVPEVADGERDQGQYNMRTDVLAVGTAGMLIRAEVYSLLGGFDKNLSAFGAGLEYSRRARKAGFRVTVASRARIRHCRLSLTHSPASLQARRFARIYNALLAAPAPLFFFLWLWYLSAGIFRSLRSLVLRDLRGACAQIGTVAKTAGIWGAVAAARARNAKTADPGRGENSLRLSESTLRDVWRARHELRRSRKEAEKMRFRPDPLTALELERKALKSRRGLFVTLVVSLLVTAALFMHFFARGVLVGGPLADDSATAGVLWHDILQPWAAHGDGLPGTSDPLWLMYLPFLIPGIPFRLTLGALLTATLYLSVAVGAVSAYLAAGRFTGFWGLRFAAALLWITAPPYLAALAEGRVPAVIVHCLLPLLLAALSGALRSRPAMPAASAFLFAVLSAAAPIFLLFAAVLAVSFVCAKRRLRFLWMVLPSLAVLLPQLIKLNRKTVLPYFFSTPGRPWPTGATLREIATGLPEFGFGFSLPQFLPFLALAVLAAQAVFALFSEVHAVAVRMAWAVGILGFVLAPAARMVTVARVSFDGGNLRQVSGWYGIYHSLSWLALAVAVTCALDSLLRRMRIKSFGPTHLLGLLLLLSVPVSAAVFALTWARGNMHSMQSLLQAKPERVIPAIAENNMASPAKSRTLVLYPTSAGIRTETWRNGGVQMHELSVPGNLRTLFGDDPADTDLKETVAAAAASSSSAAEGLARHGISVLLLPPAESSPQIPQNAPARAHLMAALSATPGLTYVTENETGAFWRVTPVSQRFVVSRAYLADSAGKYVSPLPSRDYRVGTEADTKNAELLLLAERADSGWKAQFAGKTPEPLKQKPNGWQQGWKIPSGKRGTLRITYVSPLHDGLLALQILAVTAAALLMLPLCVRKKGSDDED